MKKVAVALIVGLFLAAATLLIVTGRNYSSSTDKFLGVRPIALSPDYRLLDTDDGPCTMDLITKKRGWPLVLFEEHGSSSCPFRQIYPLGIILEVAVFTGAFLAIDKLRNKK